MDELPVPDEVYREISRFDEELLGRIECCDPKLAELIRSNDDLSVRWAKDLDRRECRAPGGRERVRQARQEELARRREFDAWHRRFMRR